MTRISRGSYKDQDAVILESAQARAVVLPEWGAKLASLVHTGLGVETLWQTEGAAYRRTTYGDGYERGEISGFDEMFPTISRCLYEAPPRSGTEAPDHGEVWTLPWEHSLSGSSVRLWVNGVRFPYRLEKEMSLEDGRLGVPLQGRQPVGVSPRLHLGSASPVQRPRRDAVHRPPRHGQCRERGAWPGAEELRGKTRLPGGTAARGRGDRAWTGCRGRIPTGWQKYWFRERRRRVVHAARSRPRP